MAVWIKSGENPEAAGTVTYGIEGEPPAVTFNSAGQLTLAGNITSTGNQQINGDLGITTSDSTGAVVIFNQQVVTVQADLYFFESGATSIVLGSNVVPELESRWQIDASGVWSLGDGTNPFDVVVERSAAGVFSVHTGNLAVSTVGDGLRVAEGSNAKQGTAVLAAGAATVANTSVTANSRIFLTSQVDGGAPGFLRVSTRTPGVSFHITSSSGTDTSTVAYQIFEPA